MSARCFQNNIGGPHLCSFYNPKMSISKKTIVCLNCIDFSIQLHTDDDKLAFKLAKGV